jgi:hypothetical protein
MYVHTTHLPITNGFGKLIPFTVTERSGPLVTRPFFKTMGASSPFPFDNDRAYEILLFLN